MDSIVRMTVGALLSELKNLPHSAEIKICTIGGEIPILSVYTSEGNTVCFDVGEDYED